MNKQKLFTFHGGIKTKPEFVIEIVDKSKKTPIPPYLYLPLSQHIGKQAIPVVNIGDKVLKGQLIADLEGPVSARIHAPTSGTIKDIANYSVPHSSGLQAECIVIATDGEDQWINHAGAKEPQNLTAQDICELVENAGIVGLGGATFPSSVKIGSAKNNQIDTLIINGVECEPYISCDEALMQEQAEAIILGAQLVQKAISAKQCIIAVEADLLKSYENLSAELKKYPQNNIKVVMVPEIYPTGGEKQLIKVLTNKEVPSGKIPASIGITCMNVGTAAAVYQAVYHGEVLMSRLVTVTGGAVERPGNYETLFGTPCEFLLEHAGIDFNRLDRMIMGGPMMGTNINDLSAPIVKGTNCLLATESSELYLPTEHAMPCIRCGRCADSCPVSLLPQQLYWYSKARDLEKVQQYNLADCIECGCCSCVCPSNISLVQYFRYAKSEIRAEAMKQQKSDLAKQRFEYKEVRLERIKAEKEAKRKHMQALKKAQADEAKKKQEQELIAQALQRVKAKKQQGKEGSASEQ